MAGVYRPADGLSTQEHGLHFTNDAWNDTILNGNEFILRWNDTIDAKDGILGLFKVTYPREGVVVYEAAQNISSELKDFYFHFKTQRDQLFIFVSLSAKTFRFPCAPRKVASHSHPQSLVLWEHSPPANLLTDTMSQTAFNRHTASGKPRVWEMICIHFGWRLAEDPMRASPFRRPGLQSNRYT